MSKFIVKIIIFSFVIVILLFVPLLCMRYYTSSIKIILPTEKNILIVGNSHSECAINDLIFMRSINFSQSGRSIPFSYSVMKRILKDNNHIDTVLLSVSSSTFSRYANNYDFKNERKFRSVLSKVVFFADTPELISLSNFKGFYEGLFIDPFKLNALPHLSEILKGSYGFYLGEFLHLERNKLDEDLKYNRWPEVVDIDTTLIEYKYLIKFKEFTDENKITLILINTPKYQVEKTHDMPKFEELREKYLSDFNYVDFSNFRLPDYCYGDVTHLNFKGAEIFSRYLEENGLKYNGNNN